MTWHDVLATISKLTELPVLSVDTCASALACKFEHTIENRYRSNKLKEPFEYAELISGKDNNLLTLKFRAESPREEYAMRMLSLGKPIDIELVSPPSADENTPKNEIGWERKYSLCYEIGERQVWFGIEQTGSHKQLISVSVEGLHP
jgi:hypothetical protein